MAVAERARLSGVGRAGRHKTSAQLTLVPTTRSVFSGAMFFATVAIPPKFSGTKILTNMVTIAGAFIVGALESGTTRRQTKKGTASD